MDDDLESLEWRSLGPASQWPNPGTARVVRLGARRIAILRGKNEWFAFKNGCPHRGLPLVPEVINADGNSEAQSVPCDGHTLRCPHHGWPFDLRNGQGPEDSSLRTYPIKEVAGELLIGV